MTSNQECALNFLNLLFKSIAHKRNFKWGFTVNTMEGTQERLCHSVFRHWLLVAQVWTQLNMSLYGICGKMS